MALTTSTPKKSTFNFNRKSLIHPNETVKMAACVEYVDLETQIFVDNPEMNLLELAIKNRLPHMQECGGNGQCTTCRVCVIDGLQNVSPRTKTEAKLAVQRNWDDNIRLACQTKVEGPVKIKRIVKTVSEVSRLQGEKTGGERGEERQLAILFCDMRNFTAFVEKNLPFDVVHIMNRLFTILGEPILMNNGYIFQYIGDEIVGLFGLDNQDHQHNCLSVVRAALGMEAALADLNADLKRDFNINIEIGIGIHFGKVVVGRIGHPSHQQFSVIGDAANVASRVQTSNKDLGTTILASQALMDQLPKDSIKVGKTANVNLRGKSKAFNLFELKDFAADDDLLTVQKTVSILFKEDGGFAEAFYSRLFEAAPDLRHLFQNNIKTQSDLMTHMLKGGIYALSRPANVILGFRKLGKRHHHQYGVKKEYYHLVGKILLETLEIRLAEKYSARIGQAWANTVQTVFSLMQEGAHS